MTDAAKLVPIPTAHLFRPLSGALLQLLDSLDAAAWQGVTSAGSWRVRDVVAHLIDGDLRRISAMRDAHLLQPDRAIEHGDDLVHWLDELNAEWVRAAARLSPRMLRELLAFTAPRIADIMEAADPHADATFPVAWTGATRSPMWLDIGREYTERWHHQDQVREAVGAQPLDSPEWLRPVLQISLLALPRAWRMITPEEGTAISLHVSGKSGGTWTLVHATSWLLVPGDTPDAACSIHIDDLLLARLLLHRLPADVAHHALHIDGDAALAAPLFTARAVMVRAI